MPMRPRTPDIPTPPTPPRAVFLDRDGVVNIDREFIHRPEDFEFSEGLFEFCRTAQRHGFALVVITNQSGIARGYYTEVDFASLTRWMLDALAREQVTIAKVYYCPFHPTGTIAQYSQESFDRKPNPGMLLRARDELGIDLGGSILVGDRLTDIEAGRRAGVPRLCLLPAPANGTAPAPDDPALQDVIVCGSLREAQERLFGAGG